MKRRAVEWFCRRQRHPLSGWNLMVSSGRRRCRTCHYAYIAAQRARVAA